MPITTNPTIGAVERMMNAVRLVCSSCNVVHMVHASEWDGNKFFCSQNPMCVKAADEYSKQEKTREDLLADPNHDPADNSHELPVDRNGEVAPAEIPTSRENSVDAEETPNQHAPNHLDDGTAQAPVVDASTQGETNAILPEEPTVLDEESFNHDQNDHHE